MESANPSFEAPDKADAVAFAAVPLPVGDKDDDFVALWLIRNIMGGNPKSRLFRRIRQQEGLSYSVGTTCNTGNGDNAGQFIFQAIANPANAPRVKEIFEQEFKRAYDDGFTAEEVKDAGQQFLRDNAMLRTVDFTMVTTISRYAKSGDDISRLPKLLDEMVKTPVDKVNAVFRKYLDPK